MTKHCHLQSELSTRQPAAASKDNIIISGASGFVGCAIFKHLQSLENKFKIIGTSRSPVSSPSQRVSPELGPSANWANLLKDTDTVIHCAALVKNPDSNQHANLQKFRIANTEGTIALARQASEAGVRRFIYISSIKVNGECTETNKPFTNSDKPAPQDAYAISKNEAEIALKALCLTTKMEFVIIRSPLVYGPGAKGNFLLLLRAIKNGFPIPLGALTENRRSLIAIDNLVDLVTLCLTHPAAANQTFLASDGDDISTTDLLKRLAAAAGKPARLISVPPSLMNGIATILGKRALSQRLLGNLQVDIRHTCQTLDWSPPVTVDQGLRQAVANTKC